MPAHQCPRCQLRFSFRTEVEHHLTTDHRPITRAPSETHADSETELHSLTAEDTAAVVDAAREPVSR
jgi:hypothetical protein